MALTDGSWNFLMLSALAEQKVNSDGCIACAAPTLSITHLIAAAFVATSPTADHSWDAPERRPSSLHTSAPSIGCSSCGT